MSSLRVLSRFLEDESGAELAEYALVVSVFGVAAIVSFEAITAIATTRQSNVQSTLTAAGTTPP